MINIHSYLITNTVVHRDNIYHTDNDDWTIYISCSFNFCGLNHAQNKLINIISVFYSVKMLKINQNSAL